MWMCKPTEKYGLWDWPWLPFQILELTLTLLGNVVISAVPDGEKITLLRYKFSDYIAHAVFFISTTFSTFARHRAVSFLPHALQDLSWLFVIPTNPPDAADFCPETHQEAARIFPGGKLAAAFEAANGCFWALWIRHFKYEMPYLGQTLLGPRGRLRVPGNEQLDVFEMCLSNLAES